jgi:NAD(P)-dependent dehydrogenase (short-subunit alcohol dehydrogenase family)
MGSYWSQFFPPSPTLTEANLPRQDGKVFIVTGGYSGVGFELCTLLNQAGGTVHLAGRSEAKALAAIAKIKVLPSPTSTEGDLKFLHLSLEDLTTINPAVERFATAESRLDVLFNNAGVSNTPRGSISNQGHDLQLATNCLGPHLFTQLLLPILMRTATISPVAGVRVNWTASIVVDISTPTVGMEPGELWQSDMDPAQNYTDTKVGNWYLANDLADQVGEHSVQSVVQNPGNVKTNIARHVSALLPIMLAPLLYNAKMGAYTAIWSAFATELTISDGGKYILPWGRLHPCARDDLKLAMKTKEEGGNGVAKKFIQYCNEQIASFR